MSKLKLNLRQVLHEKRMSQTELMRRSGISMVTINGIYNERMEGATLATISAIWSALDVPIEKLIISDNDN